MQKVSKELLAALDSGAVKLPVVADAQSSKNWDLNKLESLVKLLQLREAHLAKDLGQAMKTKMSAGQTLFNVWMTQESDAIQALARSHGERICLESVVEQIRRQSELA